MSSKIILSACSLTDKLSGYLQIGKDRPLGNIAAATGKLKSLTFDGDQVLVDVGWGAILRGTYKLSGTEISSIISLIVEEKSILDFFVQCQQRKECNFKMKKKFIYLFMTLILISMISGCGLNTTSVNSGTSDVNNTSTPEPTPTPTPSYTFDEVVVKKPNYFDGKFKAFTIKSFDRNYYGEINVGKRSYVQDASDIKGTYALFVVDGAALNVNTMLNVTFNAEGQYTIASDIGTANSDEVVYPFNVETNAGTGSSCFANDQHSAEIRKLSYVTINWHPTQAVFNGSTFNMLAVVITKAEAIQYALDGTLPASLQGLTVTGLDEIFKKPSYAPGAHDKAETPATDFEYTVIKNQVYITGYLGKGSDVVIPSKIESLQVVTIGSNAFMGNASLTNVTIPDSITTIGVQAFIDCSSLVDITFTNSIGKSNIVFGADAFRGCTSLSDKAKENIKSVIKQ